MARDPATTSRIMAAVRSHDTEPELMLRGVLHRRGLRYRLRYPLPGKPDITFVAARVAVFVDGDFWHGHGWHERGFNSMEAQFDGHADPEKWRAKIRRNMDRDLEVSAALAEHGWLVHRVLESTIRRDLPAVASEIELLVLDRVADRKLRAERGQ